MASRDMEAVQPRPAKGSCFRFRRPLRDSDPTSSMSWQSLMQYSMVGICVCVMMPCLIQGVYMALRRGEEFQMIQKSLWNLPDDEDFHTSTTAVRVTQSLFQPVGIIGGSVFALFFFSAGLYYFGTWRNVVDGFMLGLASDLIPSCIPRRKSCFAEKFRFKRRVCFVLGVAVFSIVAWLAPIYWWQTVSVKYRTCHHICRDHTLFAHIPNGTYLCEHSRMNTTSLQDAHGHSEGAAKRFAPTSEMVKECFKVFNTSHLTNYTKAVLHDGHSFLAFEASLRKHYRIYVADIYGGLLGCFIAVVVAGSKLALRKKITSLETTKRLFMMDHMITSTKMIEAWHRRFTHLDDLQGRKKSWTVSILETVSKKFPNSVEGDSSIRRAKLQEVFDNWNDTDMDDTVDDAEACCCEECDQVKFFLLAIFAAGAHTAVPICFRLLQSKPAFSTPDFQLVLFVNTLVTFLGASTMFLFLANAAVRHRSQMEKVAAFDCLWRFPGEHPLIMATRGGGSVQQSLQEGGVCQFTYLGDFSHDSTNPDSLKGLDDWFLMREYIQIDKMDERMSVEVAVSVSLAMLVPKLLVVLYNLMFTYIHDQVMEPVNYQFTIYMIWTSVMSFYALTVTLSLNNLFDAHLTKLKELKEHIKIRKIKEEKLHPEGENVLLDPAVVMVQTYLEAMNTFDLPATMFGITVNRKLLGGFIMVSATTILPQAFFIVQHQFGPMLGYVT